MTVRPILERKKSNQVLEGAGVRLDRAFGFGNTSCLLYTSPSPRDQRGSRMPSSA